MGINLTRRKSWYSARPGVRELVRELVSGMRLLAGTKKRRTGGLTPLRSPDSFLAARSIFGSDLKFPASADLVCRRSACHTLQLTNWPADPVCWRSACHTLQLTNWPVPIWCATKSQIGQACVRCSGVGKSMRLIFFVAGHVL